jgi:glycosyltransferase involved in cell wall biosynthesis
VSESPVAVLIVGIDPAARAITARSIEQQTVAVALLQAGESLDLFARQVVVIVAAGTALEATACERLTWYLSTQPGASFVTGARVRGATAAQPLASLLTCCALRLSEETAAALPDDIWQAVGHSAAQTPELALVCALTLMQRGAMGAWIRDTPVASVALTAAFTQAERAARRILGEIGVAEAVLVNAQIGGLPVMPLQRLESPVVPPLLVQKSPASGRRVLALVQGFPMGGYAAFNADLLPRLVARGDVVTTCATEWWHSDWRLDRVRAVAPDVHHAPSVVPPSMVPAYVEQLIETRAIELVFMSHSFLGYRLLPRLRARFPQVTFVDYVHTEWYERQMYGSYSTMSAQWSAYLDAHVASSKALADALVRDGAAPEKVHVAHIGIDTAAWQPAPGARDAVRAALGAKPNQLLLLFAGRVSPEKRPLLAVDALAALRARGHDVHLVVAGGGPMMAAVQQRLTERGLAAHGMVVGELDEETLRHVYSAGDIYFAPSEIEGIARALYEAMAMGCVPVVSDVGGQRELVQPGTGSLVPPEPGTIESYLPALEQWLDPAARAAASAAARAQIVATFDSAHTVAALDRACAMAAARSGTAEVATLPALADEVALLGIETTRRHVLAAR